MGFIGVQPTSAPLTASDITDGIVTASKLGSNAVTTAKINADSVTSAKLPDDVISEEHIDNTAITGFSALTSLADTDKFLVSDASDSGNLKYVENQYLGGGGAMVLLQSVSVTTTVSVVNFTNVFSDTYTNYYFVFWNVLNGINNQPFHLRFRDTSGTLLNASVYDWVLDGHNSSNSTTNNAAQDDSSIQLSKNQSGGGPTAGKSSFHGVIYAPKVTSYSSSDSVAKINWQGVYARSDVLHTVQGSGVFDNGTSVGGLQLFGEGGGGPTYTDRFEGKIYGIVDS